MHFKGQKAMGTNALFNHKKNTLNSMQGWGGSSGSQKQEKWGLLWGTAANRAEILLSPASARGGGEVEEVEKTGSS